MTNMSSNNSEKNSDKKILSIVHLLHPYVKQRIRVGENLGIFPKNMYKSNGLIDEVVISIYEKGIHDDMGVDPLKILMFDLLNTKFKTLFENEKWHKKSVSTDFILVEELKQLEENFTVDAGNDLIMNEELDDISYHQDEQTVEIPYVDFENHVFAVLDIKDTTQFKNNNKGTILSKTYYSLPVPTSNVVDLYLLGKLNLQEIANILQIEIIEVKRIIDYVNNKFKKNLD
ncbi:MAG: hypothetical protein GQ552_05885 [Flavobacteriaceae bacterium]|nr:hypothetical protein [Flavobacteriaceae bacterium]